MSAVITIDRAIFEIEFKWIEGHRDALVEIWTTTKSGNHPEHLIAALREGYGVVAMQSLDLLGPDRAGADFFAVRNDVVVTQHPTIAGTIKSVSGESIVPVVALVAGENKVRCVGTAFFISCAGLLITAAHVMTDPIDRKYGNVKEGDDASLRAHKMNFGVLVPNNPLFQIPCFRGVMQTSHFKGVRTVFDPFRN